MKTQKNPMTMKFMNITNFAQVLSGIENSVNIFIIDACRKDPDPKVKQEIKKQI
jgi:hypothetical protein